LKRRDVAPGAGECYHQRGLLAGFGLAPVIACSSICSTRATAVARCHDDVKEALPHFPCCWPRSYVCLIRNECIRGKSRAGFPARGAVFGRGAAFRKHFSN
jgi:hypothetical protein